MIISLCWDISKLSEIDLSLYQNIVINDTPEPFVRNYLNAPEWMTEEIISECYKQSRKELRRKLRAYGEDAKIVDVFSDIQCYILSYAKGYPSLLRQYANTISLECKNGKKSNIVVALLLENTDNISLYKRLLTWLWIQESRIITDIEDVHSILKN